MIGEIEEPRTENRDDRLTMTMNESADQSPYRPIRSFHKTKPPSGYENFSKLIQLSFTFFVLFCAFFTC